MNYKDAYYRLFNGTTDLIEQIKELQIQAEEICISCNDEKEDNTN